MEQQTVDVDFNHLPPETLGISFLLTAAAHMGYAHSADRAWFFNSWDRFMLPKPFPRVTIRFDDPIALSPAENETEFEAQRQAVERQMLPSVHLPPGKAGS